MDTDPHLSLPTGADDEPHELGDLDLRRPTRRPSVSMKAAAGSATLPWLLVALLLAAGALIGVQWALPMKRTIDSQTDELTQLRHDAAALQETVQGLEKEKTTLEETRAALEEDVKHKDEALAELTATQEELAQSLQDEVKRGEIAIKQAHGQLVVDVADKILFGSGEAELSEQGREVLKRVGETLLKAQNKIIQVGGHTDSFPISGKLLERFPSNWELSTARATNVVRFLQDEAKVPGTRLEAVGFAEFRPVASNATKSGRKRNRRIELRLLPSVAP